MRVVKRLPRTKIVTPHFKRKMRNLEELVRSLSYELALMDKRLKVKGAALEARYDELQSAVAFLTQATMERK